MRICYHVVMKADLSKRSSRSWTNEERRVRLDALMQWWPYAEGSLRATIEELIKDAQIGSWSAENEQMMLRAAGATWPHRVAAKQYAQEEPDRFWELFVPRCLPSTQVLLIGLAEKEATTSLKKLLVSPLADLALHESERLELDLLAPQVRALLWKVDQKKMTSFVERAKQLRDEKQKLLSGSTAAQTLSVFEHEMMYGEGD